MLYMHDVWVNWFEGEENGYNVSHYHEWRKNDGIELLDQVPLLYITEDLYNYIENDMFDLPERLLNKICNRAYIRKGQNRTQLEYACILTDGKEILAIDTIGYRIPLRKSRLIPRQEQIVFDLIKDTKVTSFKIPIKRYQKKYTILSMPPSLIFGLTRRERQLKQVLMMALDQLRTANNIEELRYWLTEWDPGSYPTIRYMNQKKVWKLLYSGMKIGWSIQHERLTKKLITGQAYLEKIWDLEQNKQQNTSNLK